jgi:hypothetical protein
MTSSLSILPTHALGVREIVEHITDHLLVHIKASGMRADWSPDTIAFRGVNKLWRQVFEDRLAVSLLDMEGTIHPWQVASPLLRILARVPTPSGAIRGLDIHDPEDSQVQPQDFVELLKAYASTSVELCLDTASLAFVAQCFAKHEGLRFTALKTALIRPGLWDEEQFGKSLDVQSVQTHIRQFLAHLPSTMSKLILGVVPEFDEDLGDHVMLSKMQMAQIESLPSTIPNLLCLWMSHGFPTPRERLIALFGRFASVERLALLVTNSLNMQGMLPDSVRHFALAGPTTAVSSILGILADPKQLPNLRSKPKIVELSHAPGHGAWRDEGDEDDSGDKGQMESGHSRPYDERKARQRVEVEAAIRGLRARTALRYVDLKCTDFVTRMGMDEYLAELGKEDVR